MKLGLARIVALVLALVGLLLSVLGPVLFVANLSYDVYATTAFEASYFVWMLCAAGFSIAGTAVALRRPENVMGWLLLTLGLAAGLMVTSDGYAARAMRMGPEVLPAGDWAIVAMYGSALFLIGMLPIVLLLFPTGSLPSHRWHPVLWMSIALLPLLVVSHSLRDEPISWGVAGGIMNPAGVPMLEEFVAPVARLSSLGPIVTIPSAALSLIVRFVGSRGDVRQQLKWVAPPVSLVLLGAGLELLGVFVPVDLVVEGMTLQAIGAALLPFAMAVAILKYHLYDIDRLLTRTVSYTVLTLTLGTLYIAAVVVLQSLFSTVSGGSDLALVMSTLFVAAMFMPARARVQQRVDRRFNRRHYDAVRTVDVFSIRLREPIDLETLRDELMGIIDDTMQPTAASILLIPAPRAGTRGDGGS